MTEYEKKDSHVKTEDRLRTLYLYMILQQYTDADHMLSTRQLQDMMMEKYGLYMHRTTVPSNVEMLRRAGFDILEHRSRGMMYGMEGRAFELPELCLLIDAVESSKFITERKTEKLIDKLLSLTSSGNASRLKRNQYTSGKVKSENERGYYIVDAINEAINTGKRISFYYTDYDQWRTIILRNHGKKYEVSPYVLIWSEQYYYMVGYNHQREQVNVFRVDRILNCPDILDLPAEPMPEGFDVSHYTKEAFRMFVTEEPTTVELLCQNDTMKNMVDRFGMDFPTEVYDAEHFKATVSVCASPTFYGWIFQWAGKIRITGPEEIKEAYRDMVKNAMEQEGE